MKKELIKVIFEYSDGSSKYIETEELKKWERMNIDVAMSAMIHHCIPGFDKIVWSEYKRNTNQKDKNNKDIFEGDKIYWKGETSYGEFEHNCIVIFDNKDFCGWVLKSLDNPELGVVPIGTHGANSNELEII